MLHGPADCSQTSQMKVTRLGRACSSGVPRVVQDQNKLPVVNNVICGNGIDMKNVQEVACSKPDELCLAGVQSEPVRRHPVLDSFNDAHGTGC